MDIPVYIYTYKSPEWIRLSIDQASLAWNAWRLGFPKWALSLWVFFHPKQKKTRPQEGGVYIYIWVRCVFGPPRFGESGKMLLSYSFSERYYIYIYMRQDIYFPRNPARIWILLQRTNKDSRISEMKAMRYRCFLIYFFGQRIPQDSLYLHLAG